MDRRRRLSPKRALLAVALAVAAGCAPAPRISVPADLPNVTRQDFLTLRWALQREGGIARAVGIAQPSFTIPWEAIVDLYGLDAEGRIVSRGSSVVRPGFDAGAAPFEVRLRESGREKDFRLVVAHSRQNTRPGD